MMLVPSKFCQVHQLHFGQGAWPLALRQVFCNFASVPLRPVRIDWPTAAWDSSWPKTSWSLSLLN